MPQTILKDLRDLNVTVIHPLDEDGESLVEHLRRIGCKVEPIWPVPKDPPQAVDILIITIERDVHDKMNRLLKKFADPKPAVLAVVNYENPATLQLVLEMDALAVIGKPVRPFGLLTNLVLSRNIWLTQKGMQEKLKRADQRLVGQKKIAKAKSILMETQQLSEQKAYESLRAQAMAKRVSLEQIAIAIINANELLSFRIGSD